MKALTYEQAQARMPAGWTLWGNYGDGKWRAGLGAQENHIVPAATMEEALERAITAAGQMKMPLSVNASTATYQLAGQQATEEGHRPGSGQWWAALRRIRAAWQGVTSASASANSI
jgi:hypothetical protein